ncbi:MAG TPA: LON peptidase substrate-binding domain-containing protein, partial [Bacilli bacterium]|nr:LON peptidase substrate-binding domain-containing protein [Bacilli bacterium]
MFTNQLKTQALLPAMAVRGVVPLPNNEIKLEVGRPESLLALQEASKFNNYIVLLFFTGEAEEPANEENVHKRGVIAQIVYDMPVINNIHKVKLNGIVRCEVRNFVQISPYMHVDVVTLPAETENIDEELAAVRLLIEELKSNSRNLLKNNPELVNTISKGVTADRLSDLLAYNLPFDLNSKLKYLDTSSVNQRLKYMLEDIKKEKYIQDIEQQIENEVRRVISENQKEYYLREKMRVIQDELGDKARKETEIEQLREKILEAKMPKSIEEKALTELDRYSSLSIASGEAGIIRTYLDFIISLPWSKASKDNMDIKKAKEQLDADHYGLDIVKDRILEYLAVRIMTKKNPQAILCLVGPPGVGKTSLAKSIAKALNKKFVKVSLGGVKDESEIRGHRRTYLGALPGRILQGMKRAGVINPVFLLDEIDKLSSDFRGDPASA